MTSTAEGRRSEGPRWEDTRREAPEQGATLVEYVLLIAFIACVCMLALQQVGTGGSHTVSVMATRITAQAEAPTGGILGSSCSGAGTCHVRVPDANRNYTYVWTLPNGSTVTQHCSDGGRCGWVDVTSPSPGQPFSVSVRGYDSSGPQYAATAMCWASSQDPGTGAFRYTCA